MNSKMVKTIFIVAGLFNIGGVLMFSMFFTNGLPGKYLPEVMGNFGLIGIMLWGLAYCAAAPGIRENRWPALVFAFEKMVYAVSWVWFVCERGHCCLKYSVSRGRPDYFYPRTAPRILYSGYFSCGCG